MPHRIIAPAVSRQLRVTDFDPPAHTAAAARAGIYALAAALWGPVTWVLVAFGLRLILVDRYPLREDEAIYGYWALHFWQDPFFLQVWPDKPPLYVWLLSPLLHFAGPSAAAARWLNIAASTLTVAVVGATARALWGRKAGMAASLVAALSPFAVSFAATVYTDPLLVLWGALAFHAAVRRKAGWAGVWLGAAIMTKQQGLLYVPLVYAALAWTSWQAVEGHPSRQQRVQSLGWALLSCLGGMALIIAPVMGWDSLRWRVAPSPWDLGMRHYGELRLVPPGEWPSRLAGWTPLAWFLTASWFVWAAALAVMAATLGWTRPARGSRPARPAGFLPALLLVWAAGFGILHVVATVQLWDRYLLPLAPVGALLAGWVVARQAEVLSPRAQIVAAACAVCLFLPPGLRAAHGALPVGGDHGDYAGLPEALAVIAAAGDDVVLYHRTLGWHARFYLYDAVRSGQVELRWFPSAAYLADNAAKASPRRKLLIEPVWTPERNLAQQLAARRLTLDPVMRSGNFAISAIGALAPVACDWCRCAAESASPPPWTVSTAVADMTPR